MAVGLAWQQGPLASAATGRDSEDVVLLHEPGRYPVAYFPLGDVSPENRIVGHAADPYHRIDIRKTSRNLVVQHGDEVIQAELLL